MKKTKNKWSTKKCARCGEPHSGYTGKLDSKGVEYVVCVNTNKRINVLIKDYRNIDNFFLDYWEEDNRIKQMSDMNDRVPENIEVHCKPGAEKTANIIESELNDGLLPCPFCGRKPKTWWDNEEGGEGYNIRCCVVDICKIYKSEATEAWNERR